VFAEFAISQVGWRHAYLVLAGAAAIILIPLYFLFFFYRPEDKGLEPYGAEKVIPLNGAADGVKSIPQDWTFSSAIRTYRLWLLVVSFLLFWGFSCYLVLAHQVQFAEDVGYSATFAAYIFAMYGIFQAVGQAVSGVSDWFGRERVITVATAFVIGAIIALISLKDTSQSWLLYAYAISLGLGGGLFPPTIFSGAADIFHGKHFGAINGLMLTGLGIGGVVGPWVGGYIHDVTGSYLGAFYLCIASSILACLCFWIAAPRKGNK
jgi:MFS family permease